jgi:hypothetical protein
MRFTNIRFQKKDKFGNMVFIANEKAEPKTFAKLTKYYKKLNTDTKTFLPIYSCTENNYATIRFKDNKSGDMCANDIYNIECSIKKVIKNNKEFINCYINKLTLVSKAPLKDYGVDIEFSDDDSD